MHQVSSLKDSPLILLQETPGLSIHLPYATSENFTKKPLYTSHHCYANKDLAEILFKAAKKAESEGYKLLIWDCYRPPEVQEQLFALQPDNLFVTAPYNIKTGTGGSNHSRGVAVDLTLTKSDGIPLEMPTPFDFFGPESYANYDGQNITGEAKKNRETLQTLMTHVGLIQCPEEWWEFTLPKIEKYPILFISDLE